MHYSASQINLKMIKNQTLYVTNLRLQEEKRKKLFSLV